MEGLAAGDPPDTAAAPEAEWHAAALPPPLPRTLRPAGFWRRWAAAVVDAVLLWFPVTILRVLLGLPLFDVDMERESTDADAIVLGVSLALSWAYVALMDASAAQGTLGKQLLAIRVERVDGARLGFLRASLRHWAAWLSVLSCGLGFLMNLWTRRRQTLHDWIAGAVLVRWEEPSPPTRSVA